MTRTFEHPDDQNEIRYTLRLPRALYEEVRAKAGVEGYTLHAALLQAVYASVRRRRPVAAKPAREAS